MKNITRTQCTLPIFALLKINPYLKNITMKKTILAFVALTFIAGMALTSCNNSTQSNSTMNTSNDTIVKGNADSLVYITDIETYRKQTDDSIAANEKRINEFNARIANEKM